MILARTYANRADIPHGAASLYDKRGALFILRDAHNDFVADNPWEAENWNLTRQGQFIAQHGLALANAFAANAGTAIGSLKPRGARVPGLGVMPIPDRNFTVVVQRKGINAPVGGGGLVGAGSSGDGDPV
jgi:hypothetical protein